MAIGFVVLFSIIANVTKIVPSHDMTLLLKKYPIWTGIGNVVAIGLTVIWGFKKTKTDFHKVFPLQSFSPLIIIPIILTVVGISILISDFDNLLRNLLHWRVKADDYFMVLYQQPVWIQIFVLMIVAPFTEEFLFRGLIFTGYLNNYSCKKAILVSAMWFALFHMNMLQFPIAFISGMLFAWLVFKTNSLWPAIFAHAVMNGLQIFVTKVLQVQIMGYNCQNEAQNAFQPLWFDLLGVVLVLAGLGLFWVLKERIQKPLELMRTQLPEEIESVEDIENPPPAGFNVHGWVAFITGIVTFLTLVGIFIWVSTRNRYGFAIATKMILGVVALLGLAGCLIGVGFGIASLLKKQSRAIAWTGLILNGVYLLFSIFAVAMAVNR